MKKTVIMLAPDIDMRGGISFVIQEYFKGKIDQKVELYFIPTHTDGSRFRKLQVFVRAFFKFLSLAPMLRNSVVHLHTSQNGSFIRKFIFFITAKTLGAKTVVHIHGSQFDTFMTRNFLFRSLTEFYIKNADRVLVMSGSWLQKLTPLTNNALLVYNPVSLASKERGKNGKLNILFLGRLGKRKGVYDLLECIDQNREYFQKEKVGFILAGDGDVEKMGQFIAEHNLTDFIDMPGWVLSEQKEKYLKTSDILILPSYNEQMPMSILEGMGYGYPILATNIAGIPEMVKHGENGFLFEPGDIKTMMLFIKNLCEDAALREKMGERSKQLVEEKFENSKIVDQLVSIYESL